MQKFRSLLIYLATTGVILGGLLFPLATARAEGGSNIGGAAVCVLLSDLCNWGAEEINLTVTVTPGTSGAEPFTPTISNAVGGTATGTINYSIWFNCNGQDATTNIVAVTNACGNPATPAVGIKQNNSTTNPFNVTHTYNEGTYKYKVIVERGSAEPKTATVVITVAPPPPPPTLSLSLSADPGTTGLAPFSPMITHTPGGTATGTINYTGWYSCPSITDADIAAASYATFLSKCGNPNDPTIGFKVDNTITTPYLHSADYLNAGTYTYLALVERSTAPAAGGKLVFTITEPTVVNPPSVTLKINGSNLPQYFNSMPATGTATVNLAFTWEPQNGARECILSRNSTTFGSISLPVTAFSDSVTSYSSAISFDNGTPSGPYAFQFRVYCAQPSPSSSTVDVTFNRLTTPPVPAGTGNTLNFGTGSRRW